MRSHLTTLLLVAITTTSACSGSSIKPTVDLGPLLVAPAISVLRVGSTAHFKATGGNGAYLWILVDGPGFFWSDGNHNEQGHYLASLPGLFTIRVESGGNSSMRAVTVGGRAID